MNDWYCGLLTGQCVYVCVVPLLVFMGIVKSRGVINRFSTQHLLDYGTKVAGKWNQLAAL